MPPEISPPRVAFRCRHDPIDQLDPPCQACFPGLLQRQKADSIAIVAFNGQPNGGMGKAQDGLEAVRVLNSRLEQGAAALYRACIQNGEVLESCAHWVKVRFDDGSQIVCPVPAEHNGLPLFREKGGLI